MDKKSDDEVPCSVYLASSVPPQGPAQRSEQETQEEE